MRGDTTGNEGPYINFENLGTLPQETHSTARGRTYDHNGSGELIISHSNIMKTGDSCRAQQR